MNLFLLVLTPGFVAREERLVHYPLERERESNARGEDFEISTAVSKVVSKWTRQVSIILAVVHDLP
jgi:hypothetical protein